MCRERPPHRHQADPPVCPRHGVAQWPKLLRLYLVRHHDEANGGVRHRAVDELDEAHVADLLQVDHRC